MVIPGEKPTTEKEVTAIRFTTASPGEVNTEQVTGGNEENTEGTIETDGKSDEKSLIDEPVTHKQKTSQTNSESETEEPGSEEPGTEEPTTGGPGTGEQGTGKPGTKSSKTRTEKPGSEEPGSEKPGTEEPRSEDQETEEPETEQPETEEPETEEPETEKPDGTHSTEWFCKNVTKTSKISFPLFGSALRAGRQKFKNFVFTRKCPKMTK